MGGALMVPVGRLVVLRTTEKKDLVRSIAYITWPGLAAPVIGPPVGGFITTYSSWRWIFFLNVPLGFIGIALAFAWIRNAPGHGRRFDWLGFALAGSACTSIMYSLELLGQQNVRWTIAGLFLGYGAIAGWISVWHMRRTDEPLIQFDALKQRTFAVVIWGGSLFRLAISVSPFLLPLMFQIAFGLNAFQSGLLVLAMFAGNLFMKPATTPILRAFGFRRVLVVNGLVTAALIGSFGLLGPTTPTALMIVLLFAHGLSRSMQFTAISTLAFVDITQPQMSSANSFFTVMTQMSMGMGVAVGAVTLRLAAWLRGEPASAPTIADFHFAFGMVSIIAVLAVVDCLSLDRNAGAEVSGHART
jgi:hypothetical protein